MEIYFSDPSSQISWSLFSGPSGFGEFPIYGNAGFHKVYVGGIRDSKSKVERAWLTDWLLRQGLTGCLHFSECPVVPEPGPHYQKFRNSVCISSSRGTLALGDWFIKTKVTGDFLIFKQIDRQTNKHSLVLDSSLLPDPTWWLIVWACSSVKEILNKHPNICVMFISKLDTYCCANMLWISWIQIYVKIKYIRL